MTTNNTTRAAKPPGPGLLLSDVPLFRLPANRLEFLTNTARKFGDIAYLRIEFERAYLVHDPELIREVLVTSHRNFLKGRGLERVKRLLGEGLLTSEGELHLRQRRMIQPAFHQQKIEGFARQMSEEAERTMSGWHDGQEVDIAREMTALTLRIVGRTLFGSDVTDTAHEVSSAMNALMESFYLLMLPFPSLIERLPIPSVQRMLAGRKRLDEIIYALINERRKSGAKGDDLLSMLLQAQDVEGDGGGMSDRQVRDEAMTIFLAGHETTANAMAWTWYLLSQNPDVERKLHEEVDRVLGDRLPNAADHPALVYTEKVIMESMRLYPPAWIVARRAIAEQKLGGYKLPPRALVLMSQWVVHRDPRFFPEPLRFDPDRWTPEFRAALPKYAYFPFGGGPRLCIGEGFAWMETTLLAAAISRRWHMELLPDQEIIPEPVVTLRPRNGIKMRLHRRSAPPSLS